MGGLTKSQADALFKKIRHQNSIMSELCQNITANSDPALNIPLGIVEGTSSVNKFGHAPSGVQTSDTDIWDRSDATPTQQIWVAPTEARIHDIVSTAAGDTLGGVGAQTIQVYGLTSWDTPEVSEVLEMDGTTDVPTTNAYVIIHRMKILTKGATNVNVGVITATAQSDSTVTAQINIGEGQTQMAIYGIPSTQTAYITQYYTSIEKASGAAATITTRLKVNSTPDLELTQFITKHILGVQSTGTSTYMHTFNPYTTIPGPAIIKLQGLASTSDIEGSGGFDLILVNN